MPQAIISIEQREAHRWTAEVEVGFPICRRQVVNAGSFYAIMDLVRSTHDAMQPQPKPAVEALPEPPVEVLPDDFHLPSEPFDPDLHFVISPEQANDLRADPADDIQQHVALPPEAVAVPVAVTPKRRGRPPRARDSNDDGA